MAGRGYDSPGNWKTLRRRVLERDEYRCHVCGGDEANEVDHIIPVSRGGTHDLDNLAAIHATPCHAAKSHAERVQGKALKGRRRPPEAHPGRIR